MGRVFANGPRDRVSISSRVIPKTQNMVLDPSLFNTQHYELWFKGKLSKPSKGIVLSPTPRCSSYWKWSLQVALDYSQTTYIYIYVSISASLLMQFSVLPRTSFIEGSSPSSYSPYLPNPSARVGYDTRSIFKRSLTGLNSEFSFS